MLNQYILLVSFLAIVFFLIAFKILRSEKNLFVVETLSKIKKDLQSCYDLHAVLETRDYPPYLQFSISEDLNEAFLIVQETLKGFGYETHEHVFFMNENIHKASFFVYAHYKKNSDFKCEIICTNFKRGVQGKSQYRVYIF